MSLKALAMRLLMRDSAGDNVRATRPAVPLMPVPLPALSGTDSGTLSLSPGFLRAAQLGRHSCPTPTLSPVALLAAAERNPAVRIADRAGALTYFAGRAQADSRRPCPVCGRLRVQLPMERCEIL